MSITKHSKFITNDITITFKQTLLNLPPELCSPFQCYICIKGCFEKQYSTISSVLKISLNKYREGIIKRWDCYQFVVMYRTSFYQNLKKKQILHLSFQQSNHLFDVLKSTVLRSFQSFLSNECYPTGAFLLHSYKNYFENAFSSKFIWLILFYNFQS